MPARGILCAVVLLIPITFAGCAPSPHDLAMQGDLEALKVLFETDPDDIENQSDLGKTALHHAITGNQSECAAWLLEVGANIEAADRTGMRPLHVAAALNHGWAVTMLLDAGADLEARDSFGDTPLHTAAMFGGTKAINELLARGADVTASNEEGLTPGALAAKHRRTRIADFLNKLAARAAG